MGFHRRRMDGYTAQYTGLETTTPSSPRRLAPDPMLPLDLHQLPELGRRQRDLSTVSRG